MSPSRSDSDKRTATGLGFVTNILLSPQNPENTQPMGFGKFMGLSTSSSSSQPRGIYRPPLGPGSSKADYAHGLDSPGPSTSSWSAPSYDRDDDAPPPYFPQGGSGVDDVGATDLKEPAPHKIRADAVYHPAPDWIHKPIEFNEDALLPLENYDVTIILDDSVSMLEKDSYHKSRWEQAWIELENLVNVGGDKIGGELRIHFLNRDTYNRRVKTARDVRRLREEVREPRGRTHSPMGDVLDELLVEYMDLTGKTPRLTGVKKRCFIVITDGAASDAPEDVIIRAAKFFEENNFPLDQVGIQFIQVGNDKKSSEFLDNLDRDLCGPGGCARDMVDTVRSKGACLGENALIKALIGGFNRKQDRMGER